MRRAGALALASLLLAATPARAEDVSSAELRRLASLAASDPEALDRLRRVDSVDGRPADVGSALRGAGGKEAAGRLGHFQPAPGAVPGDPRARARELLRDRRYRGTRAPRPFTGALRWIEDRLRPVWEAIEDVFRSIARVTPGGTTGVWLLLAIVIVALAALIGRQTIRRRAVTGAGTARSPAIDLPERPRDLERAAEAAERDERWEEAVRLRFRAGLLRLDERRVLEYRPSLTTGEVADALRLEPFERLGTRFDAIAYGGRDAGPDDAGAARTGWAEVIELAGRP